MCNVYKQIFAVRYVRYRTVFNFSTNILTGGNGHTFFAVRKIIKLTLQDFHLGSFVLEFISL
jgi:hypothetical protein